MRTETFDILVFFQTKIKTYFLSEQVLRCQELQTVLCASVCIILKIVSLYWRINEIHKKNY